MATEIRPRFELSTDETRAPLMDRLSRELRAPGCPLCGIVAADRIELYVPPGRQRLWSPELQVDVRDADDGAVLSCTYAPHPHVWVAYAAILALSAIGGTAALTFALAEWSMKMPMVALYALPPLGVVFAVTYGMAFVGQKLATDEMDELRSFLEDVVASSAPRASGVRHRVPQADRGSARRTA